MCKVVWLSVRRRTSPQRLRQSELPFQIIKDQRSSRDTLVEDQVRSKARLINTHLSVYMANLVMNDVLTNRMVLSYRPSQCGRNYIIFSQSGAERVRRFADEPVSLVMPAFAPVEIAMLTGITEVVGGQVLHPHHR